MINNFNIFDLDMLHKQLIKFTILEVTIFMLQFDKMSFSQT